MSADSLDVLGTGGDVCRYVLDSLARKMTRAQCARLRRTLAKDKHKYLPSRMLKKDFWDYNGAIVAVTQPRRSPSSTGKYSYESWQLEGERFRFLSAQ